MGSMGFAGDFYIAGQNGAGAGAGRAKQVGVEQISDTDTRGFINERVIHNGYPVTRHIYTWEQFLSRVDWRGDDSMRRSQYHESDLFFAPTGTLTFQDAMRLARYGWTEILPYIHRIKNNFSVPPNLHPRQTVRLQHNVAGGGVNIGKYLMGAPDCMNRTYLENQFSVPVRFKKIFVSLGYSFDTDEATTIRRGSEIFKSVEALELSNIRTEIIICGHNISKDNDIEFYETYVKLKAFDETFYPEKILFALAHPSSLRRLMFSEYERNPWEIRKKFHFYIEPWHGGDHNKFGYGRTPNSESCVPSLVEGQDCLYFYMCEDNPNLKDTIATMISNRQKQY